MVAAGAAMAGAAVTAVGDTVSVVDTVPVAVTVSVVGTVDQAEGSQKVHPVSQKAQVASAVMVVNRQPNQENQDQKPQNHLHGLGVNRQPDQ